MRTTQKGKIHIQKLARWSSMYEMNAPAMALERICWIQTDENFDLNCEPGEDMILLMLCRHGRGIVEFENHRIVLTQNNAFLLNIRCGYHCRSESSDFRFVFLLIKGSFARQILFHQLKDRGHVLSIDKEAFSTCEKIYDLAAAGWSYENEIRISCLLYELSGLMLISQARDPELAPAVSRIHTQYAKCITTEDLAALCFLGTSQFIRRFNLAYGITPKRYLNNYRISRAKELLLETKLPVAVISQRVGFEDGSYFTRLFRKLTGSTPRKYRLSALGLDASSLEIAERKNSGPY